MMKNVNKLIVVESKGRKTNFVVEKIISNG